MAENENLKEEIAAGGTEGLDTPMVLIVGVISALFVFVVIISSIAFFNSEENIEEQKKVVDVKYEEVSGIVAGQQAELEGYRVVDQAKGICTIPIEDAMKKVVEEEGKKNPPPVKFTPAGGGKPAEKQAGK